MKLKFEKIDWENKTVYTIYDKIRNPLQHIATIQFRESTKQWDFVSVQEFIFDEEQLQQLHTFVKELNNEIPKTNRKNPNV